MIYEEGNLCADPYYDSHVVFPDGTAKRVDTDDYWDDEGLHLPEDYRWLNNRSKVAPRFGHLVTQMTLPDLSGYSSADFWIGFELGIGVVRGIAAFRTTEANDLKFWAGGMGRAKEVVVTDLLPADAFTADHYYAVKVNRGFASLWIDYELKAVIIPGTGADVTLYDNTEPYPIRVLDGKMPTAMNTLAEIDAGGKSVDVPPDVTLFRWAVGEPAPPRTYRLYDAGASTLLTSGTYDTGVSHKSHPVPIAGYDKATLLFRADTDSVADGLTIEILTQEGNWRTYRAYDYTGGTLHDFTLAGSAPLMRIGYEPSADGASITDAEVSIK